MCKSIRSILSLINLILKGVRINLEAGQIYLEVYILACFGVSRILKIA